MVERAVSIQRAMVEREALIQKAMAERVVQEVALYKHRITSEWMCSRMSI